MQSITKKAYGKLNLTLDTIGKREDGYHLVQMIMQTVDIHDTITITRRATPGITLSSNREDLPTNQDNLIFKAAKLLIEEFQLTEGVNIHLEKRIPVAAGMAGGSTDCAATLTGINTLFKLGLSEEELMQRAITMGADIPYCILGGTALSEGIGEILTPLKDIVPCHVLLIKPNIDISTKWVYSNLQWNQLTSHPDLDGMLDALEQGSIAQISQKLENVLETVTIPANPIIQTIKDTMLELGACNALMSGSGPTVFGLFPDEVQGKHAYAICKERFPEFQVEWTKFVTRKEAQKNI